MYPWQNSTEGIGNGRKDEHFISKFMKNHDFITTGIGTIVPLFLIQVLNHFGIADVTLTDLAKQLPELIAIALLGFFSNNNK
ncbi:hypothetical protein NIES4101_53600 [Calothrix sp. NIES-4101]|nr:hypothetical protein NIES4101_53600 [Calothrix sp. NIES-4101]